MTGSRRPIATPALDGLALGFVAQLLVLATLDAYVPLGRIGWLCGVGFAVATWVVLGRALRRSGMRALGPANAVTLARTTLIGGVLALVAGAVAAALRDTGPTTVPTTVLVGLAAVALALDGVDGQVARRTGSTSELGARFDMEVDALLIMVLSVFVASTYGWWVLGIGALRYVFVAAAWSLPWLRAGLPARFSRKVVAAVQGVALAVAAAGVLPEPVTGALLGLALSSLCWSFGRDASWLWVMRHRRDVRVPAARPRPLEAAATATHG